MDEVITTDYSIFINSLYECFPTLVKLFESKNKNFIIEASQLIAIFK